MRARPTYRRDRRRPTYLAEDLTDLSSGPIRKGPRDASQEIGISGATAGTDRRPESPPPPTGVESFRRIAMANDCPPAGRDRLERAAATLRADERAALSLHAQGELSNAEIAA